MTPRALLPSIAILLLSSAVPAWSQAPVDLAAPGRQAGDAARDPLSKPVAVFSWLEVEPGDVVVDYHAGGGYNTWILSRWVGPEGVVFAEMPGDAEEIRSRLESGDLADAGNVAFVQSLAELPTDSLDVFFISRYYHDVPADEIPAFLAEVERTLKPGGTFAVVDARTPEGRDEEGHRIADSVIVGEVTGAGFELVASSELLANDDDDYDGPQWDNRSGLDTSLLKFKVAGAED